MVTVCRDFVRFDRGAIPDVSQKGCTTVDLEQFTPPVDRKGHPYILSFTETGNGMNPDGHNRPFPARCGSNYFSTLDCL